MPQRRAEMNFQKAKDNTMQAYTYVAEGKFALTEKPKPVLLHERDAIVKVTLASICSSDLHIKHGSVPRAVPGITVGHEMVGVVESVGSAVTHVQPGDRVTVNVETFCGDCFFCKRGYVNNCTDKNGGWALGCRIDGGPAAWTAATVPRPCDSSQRASWTPSPSSPTPTPSAASRRPMRFSRTGGTA